MKATVEKLEKNRVILEVEVEAPRLEQALDKAYRKLVRQVNIPGFRRGKAPRFILERYMGKEPLYHEAMDIVIPSAYREAVEETKIEPIDQPEVEIVQAEEGQPLIFKATVDVKPEVQLGQYKGIPVERPEVKVTDEDVEAFLKRLQERFAQLKDVEEGSLQEGDTAIIDFKGEVEGQDYPGLKGENYPLEIGSGTFIPGFEAQLVGAKVDEEREVKVTFPADYHRQELAGKEAVFAVKIRGIKRKQLAPLDDEFAKDVSEYETLEELKEDIRERLREEQEQRAAAEVRRQVIEKAVANAAVELPPVLVERRIGYLINDMAWRLQSQGVSLEQLMERSGKTWEQLKEEMRPQAEKDVKTDLVLEAIAKAEGMEATQEDVDREIEKMAQLLQQPLEKVRERMEKNLEGLQYDIVINKTIDFLVNHSIPADGGGSEDVRSGADSSGADQ
ncbi:MAG: trigger factor [Thermoanaerobacteraceae bacterium]|nr:trigger factor [Thermoanaerobacteraceae bacterium]